MKYIKVTRSDAQGNYIHPVHSIGTALDGELDDIEYLEGLIITLEVVEMDQAEYEKLPEFPGW